MSRLHSQIILKPRPLTRKAFRPFGDVIEPEESRAFSINDGMATRYDNLAQVDVLEAGGRVLINIFRGRPWPMPLTVRMVERHPLSSQAFIPLAPCPFLVVVAPRGERVSPEDLRAFLADSGQGVNYHRGVWHHPLIALDKETDFLVVDRGGEGENCEEYLLDKSCQVVIDPEQSGRKDIS